jgi:hypothetical protein
VIHEISGLSITLHNLLCWRLVAPVDTAVKS